MLHNHLYIWEIEHKGTFYPGEHDERGNQMTNIHDLSETLHHFKVETEDSIKVLDSQLEKIRIDLNGGDGVGQDELCRIADALLPFKEYLRPKDKSEKLPLFTNNGNPTGTHAPRWICHLLGLRHCCAHILLTWNSPKLGEVYLLQIRSLEKDDSPGHIDISVGGHMSGDTASPLLIQQTAYKELEEELGLIEDDLTVGLTMVNGNGYGFNENPRNNEHFFNIEWRQVFVAHVKDNRIGKIHFKDGEVLGILPVAVVQAQSLLDQTIVPLASALTESLKFILGGGYR